MATVARAEGQLEVVVKYARYIIIAVATISYMSHRPEVRQQHYKYQFHKPGPYQYSHHLAQHMNINGSESDRSDRRGSASCTARRTVISSIIGLIM